MTEKQRWSEFTMKAEPGDAVLTRTIRSFKWNEILLKPVSVLIQDTTKSRWTHVSQYRGSGMMFSATFPRAEANSYLDSYQPRWFNYTEVAIIRLNAMTIDEWQAVKTFWYNKILGSKYDVAQLLGIKINEEFNHWDKPALFAREDQYVCSESFYKSNMYANVDVSIPGIHPTMFAPRHVADLVRIGKARLIDHFIPEKFSKYLKQGDIWEFDYSMMKLAKSMNPDYQTNDTIA